MSKLRVDEILDIVESNGISVADFACGDFDPIPEIGDYEVVDKYGGEDQGSTWYNIKHFKDHDVYIRTDGWYSSYEAMEFEDGYGVEVFPKKKMITVYI